MLTQSVSFLQLALTYSASQQWTDLQDGQKSGLCKNRIAVDVARPRVNCLINLFGRTILITTD